MKTIHVHVRFVTGIMLVCLVSFGSLALTPMQKNLATLNIAAASNSGFGKFGAVPLMGANGTFRKFLPPIKTTGTTGKTGISQIFSL